MTKLTSITFAALLAIGCGKDKDKAGGDKAAGGLGAKIETARNSVNPNDAWPDTTARLEKELGAPQSKGDKEWVWAAVDGDSCYRLQLLKQSDQDKVSGAMGGKVSSMVTDKFEACKKLAAGTP